MEKIVSACYWESFCPLIEFLRKEEMELEQGAVSMVKGCFLYNAGALEESQKKKKKQIKSSMSSECTRLSSIESTFSS